MNGTFIRSGSRTGGAGDDAEGILDRVDGRVGIVDGSFGHVGGILGYRVARVRIWVTMADLASA